MNIANALTDVELMENKTDRCIAFAGIILHLEYLKLITVLHPTGSAWKDDINGELTKTVHKEIDKNITLVKELLERTIND